MCLIELISTNLDFSFIIFKNPENGMQIRSIRKGKAFGYYPKNEPNKYIIYFRDDTEEMSYKEDKEQSFEYLNKLRYTSPIFVLNAIAEFLHSSAKKQHEQDIVGQTNTFKMVAVQVDGYAFSTINRINKFFDKFTIKLTKEAHQTHEIEITTQESIYMLLNFVIVYFGLISALNDNDLDLTENLIEKLINSLNIINAEYYVRYILSSKILTSKKLFESLKCSLEIPGIQLQYGNTATQRLEYIKGLLNFDKPIIDIGCGEGAYAIPFAQKLKKSALKYYAIDINEDELARVSKKAIEKELDIITLNSHDKLVEHIDWNIKYDVIITEVIEHMDKEESQNIIRWVLNNVNFDKIIITTPNVEFNVHYMLGDQLRHDDHKWELTREQFKEYFSDIIIKEKNNIKYLDIGDIVYGVASTQGALITGS